MPRFAPPSTRQVVGRALLVGFAAGLRSMTPLGVLAAERNDASLRAEWRSWPVLSHSLGRVALQGSAAGEMVMDKMPFVPPRIDPKSLWARLLTGGIAGLAIGTLRHGGAIKGTSLAAGVLGSLAGSYGGYAYRSGLTKATGLPDLPVALVEDAAAVLIARKGVRG